ncbi:hypothetical protein [Actinomadura bangladeshensis]|uniref:Uncharacterized protein n=1 Tax=Actinomadura bangladeshensis TaxID=453573 RepID=A0A4R4NX20_9ACTN|nr:hypothetical protein [Actinomadura bangladeshensis]TDC12022.1 hypothetical protein E1284_25580 [Actinomadura bangladeshensis]
MARLIGMVSADETSGASGNVQSSGTQATEDGPPEAGGGKDPGRPVLVSVISLAGVLLAAIIALMGVWASAQMARDATASQQKNQITEERKRLAMDKRLEIYTKFSEEISRCHAKIVDIADNPAKGRVAKRDRDAAWEPTTICPGFQRQFTQMGIFASEPAWQIATRVRLTLVLLRSEANSAPSDELDCTGAKVLHCTEQARALYQEELELLNVMCRDLAPVPRSSCFAHASPAPPRS